jgi:hypothetical protein
MVKKQSTKKWSKGGAFNKVIFQEKLEKEEKRIVILMTELPLVLVYQCTNYNSWLM